MLFFLKYQRSWSITMTWCSSPSLQKAAPRPGAPEPRCLSEKVDGSAAPSAAVRRSTVRRRRPVHYSKRSAPGNTASSSGSSPETISGWSAGARSRSFFSISILPQRNGNGLSPGCWSCSAHISRGSSCCIWMVPSPLCWITRAGRFPVSSRRFTIPLENPGRQQHLPCRPVLVPLCHLPIWNAGKQRLPSPCPFRYRTVPWSSAADTAPRRWCLCWAGLVSVSR